MVYMKRGGFTIIETVLSIGIFSLITLTFYAAYVVTMNGIIHSRIEAQASALLNEKLEIMRNLPYDEVALQGGFFGGSIPPNEIVTIGGRSFYIKTDIRYFDDSEDGTEDGSPDDTIPTDYKRVEITAKWGEQTDKETIVMYARFVPPGIETDKGGGTLSINVIDYAGQPVTDVSLTLYNDQVSPVINYSTTTDEHTGNLLLPGTPQSDYYEITLSKSGHKTVTTFPSIAQGGTYEPEDPHVSVVDDVLNQWSFEMNLESDMDIHIQDGVGADLENIEFHLVGGRQLDDGVLGPTTFTHNQDHTSDSSGLVELDNIHGGAYTFSLDASETEYTFWKLTPEVDDIEKSVYSLSYGTDEVVDAILLEKTLDSVLVSVQDDSTADFIESASVQLKHDVLGYDTTLMTDIFGQAYFPISGDVADSLQQGETYDLVINATDYNESTTTVTVNALTTVDVILTGI